ncbi:hypothetical protein COCVIDRAFT_104580 [Bipolaris victoriae FI3]|uniref:Uncharacterized protein n=1 Tax=Bipolaris victoriae (strain FI3) TaxID=930091 RepID=W7EDC3_BIPV3|nr:hypothetical protein COCVIDRAFT_104580 [Bipolaris victoriae FI3]
MAEGTRRLSTGTYDIRDSGCSASACISRPDPGLLSTGLTYSALYEWSEIVSESLQETPCYPLRTYAVLYAYMQQHSPLVMAMVRSSQKLLQPSVEFPGRVAHCAALRRATALSLLKPVLRIAHVVDAVMPSMPLVAAASSRKSGGRAAQPCIREITHCHTAARFDSSDKDNPRVAVPKSHPNSQSVFGTGSRRCELGKKEANFGRPTVGIIAC